MTTIREQHDQVRRDIADLVHAKKVQPMIGERAEDAKTRWKNAARKLEAAKEAHREWRQEHRLASWFHDKGLLRNDTLTKHADRQQRYTTREADAFDAHALAREDVRRVDQRRDNARASAIAGLQRLAEAPREGPVPPMQREPTSQPRQTALAPEPQTPEPAREKLDRFSGELLDHGKAPYQHNAANPESYFATLRLKNGSEVTHWGKDLERALVETSLNRGDRVRLAKTGQDHDVEVVGEDKQRIPAVRRGWSATKLEHEPVAPTSELPKPRDQCAPEQGPLVKELLPPRPRSALAERVAEAMGQPSAPKHEVSEQGEQGGSRRGGQERPSHSSYYQPVPAGEMAPPQPERRRRGWER